MEKFMRLALIEAEKAKELNEVPVGAVIVCENKIISKTHNTREQSQDPTNHAEIRAIKKAAEAKRSWRLDDCEIYVTKEPCPMCAGAIFQARIKKLIYGCSDEKQGYAGTLHNTVQDKRLNWQTEIVKGILEEECRQILQEFFKNKRS